MATISEIFAKTINEGMKATAQVKDPQAKATLLAEFAIALARTGLIVDSNVSSELPTSDDAPIVAPQAEGKSSLRSHCNEKKKDVPAEPEPSASAEPELTEEWDDNAMAVKAVSLAYVVKLQEDYEEDAINAVVEEFGEGNLHSIGDVTPLNIDAFVNYVKMKLTEAAA